MSIKDSLMINENTDAGIARVLAMLGTAEGSESILEILGQTGDTGGSATAGTAMAKLNALQGDSASLQELCDNTAAYASGDYIDMMRLRVEKMEYGSIQEGRPVTKTLTLTGRKKIIGISEYGKISSYYATMTFDSIEVDGEVLLPNTYANGVETIFCMDRETGGFTFARKDQPGLVIAAGAYIFPIFVCKESFSLTVTASMTNSSIPQPYVTVVYEDLEVEE